VQHESYARDKIIRYIKQLYQKQNKNVLSLTLTRSELADHLLMDTSTLMRELKQMKKEGIIDYNRNKITITDTSLLS
jgi:DNA-binding MarR family transcriptional regulator